MEFFYLAVPWHNFKAHQNLSMPKQPKFDIAYQNCINNVSKIKQTSLFLLWLLLLGSAIACQKNIDPINNKAFSKIPDYDWVFPADQIRTLKIDLGPDNWKKIQTDMEGRIAKKFGSSISIPGVALPPFNGLDIVPGDPIYVEAEVSQDDVTWSKVGFRLKGNASLNTTWQNGIYKLPFKLQFDEFENKYPKIKNQRFFGFRELSFAPSFGDNTFMKEKILNELYRKAGILACKVAYYKVFIDFGTGSQYCGIYQVVEPVQEHMVAHQLGKVAGNVYKPESSLQSFLASQFEKQNNKEQANFEDVKSFISTLNSASRLNEHKKWKEDLEKIFDVRGFLTYLAVNNTVGNWDSYGQLTHNYYLVSIDGKLTWIPYDLNLSFQMKGGNNRTALTMKMDEVGSKWPLIRYLIDDPEYYAFYKSKVKEFIEGAFSPVAIKGLITNNKTILEPNFTTNTIEKRPYTNISSPQSFQQAVLSLENYVTERYAIVNEFINN